MDLETPHASRWADRSTLRTRTDIEIRLQELTRLLAATPATERDDASMTEIEILTAAAFMDPVARTPRGDMPLSRALTIFSDAPPSDFKRTYLVDDYARNFDKAYDLVRDVVGENVAFALMDDVLTETGDPVAASMLAIEHMVSPTSRYRKYARPAAPAVPSDRHPLPA